MGYKLAGFDVLGVCEIDPQMAKIYRKNHSPKLFYEMPIQQMVAMPDAELDPALFDLDILDGSPPCSVFSMAGSREKKWGSEHAFREGQTTQRLDDLFFVFIRLADRLRPKVVIAENVKGMLNGNARGYCKEIFEAFDQAGYDCQLFLLNASRMGVPQARERTFFVARRKDLGIPVLRLEFSEAVISCRKAFDGILDGSKYRALSSGTKELMLWRKAKPGDAFSKVTDKGWFSNAKISPLLPSRTVTACSHLYHWSQPRCLSAAEFIRLQSFPEDYDFLDASTSYVCGMSVPPLMTQRVALEVAKVLLNGKNSIQ